MTDIHPLIQVRQWEGDMAAAFDSLHGGLRWNVAQRWEGSTPTMARVCDVLTCSRPKWAHGLCSMHAERYYRRVSWWGRKKAEAWRREMLDEAF